MPKGFHYTNNRCLNKWSIFTSTILRLLRLERKVTPRNWHYEAKDGKSYILNNRVITKYDKAIRNSISDPEYFDELFDHAIYDPQI